MSTCADYRVCVCVCVCVCSVVDGTNAFCHDENWATVRLPMQSRGGNALNCYWVSSKARRFNCVGTQWTQCIRRHRRHNSGTIKDTRHTTVHVTKHVIDDTVLCWAELNMDTRSLAWTTSATDNAEKTYYNWPGSPIDSNINARTRVRKHV